MSCTPQGGDICRYNTFVVSGKVRTFCLNDNGNEHIIAFGIENWWVGDLGSFITQAPADFNVQCLENTEVIQLSYNDLQVLYKDIPQLERFFRLIIQKTSVNSQSRIVRNYSLSARERYLLFLEEYPEIGLSVGSPQLLQSLEFQHLYNSLIVKVSNIRRVARNCTACAAIYDCFLS